MGCCRYCVDFFIERDWGVKTGTVGMRNESRERCTFQFLCRSSVEVFSMWFKCLMKRKLMLEVAASIYLSSELVSSSLVSVCLKFESESNALFGSFRS